MTPASVILGRPVMRSRLLEPASEKGRRAFRPFSTRGHMLTPAQFKKLFPWNKEPEAWVIAINNCLPRYGINTPLRLAAFLAQCGHESYGFTDLTENLNYSAEGLANTWPKRYAVDPKTRIKQPNSLALSLHRKPAAIANNVYANRMGNGTEKSGDGWRFRGYGPLQITGRGNREAFAKSIGRSLEESEAYLLTKEGGIEAACWFWTTHALDTLADAGDIVTITKRINGGTNGLNERKAVYSAALTVLAA